MEQNYFNIPQWYTPLQYRCIRRHIRDGDHPVRITVAAPLKTCSLVIPPATRLKRSIGDSSGWLNPVPIRLKRSIGDSSGWLRHIPYRSPITIHKDEVSKVSKFGSNNNKLQIKWIAKTIKIYSKNTTLTQVTIKLWLNVANLRFYNIIQRYGCYCL